MTRIGSTTKVASNGGVFPAIEIGDLGSGRIGLLTEWSQVDFATIAVTAPPR